MVIIGIDPGTATTGYGIIRAVKKKGKEKSLSCVDYGVIETKPSSTPEKRLKKLNNELNKLLRKYQPKILAVESVYFFKNLKTAIPVSEAKGVILLTAAKKNITVRQFTPLQVKMNICGYGRGSKAQIQKMVREILALDKTPKPDDAADALAIAISCAWSS
jgi:crossover junction endodeoxyribonuclease RuvC